MIGWSLYKAHEALDATERDRLRGQARVVDDNVGQQLDGVNRALASVARASTWRRRSTASRR